jgi:hypothetical protein
VPKFESKLKLKNRGIINDNFICVDISEIFWYSTRFSQLTVMGKVL